jgi:DNA gyrase/topoisomerase IV subunit B
MRFDRIIIMTDADADGYHIVALLIGLLYKINPLILEEGRVMVTNPPLYSILHGNKVAYLRDVEALDEARRVTYRTLLDIDVLVGGKTKFKINNDVDQFRDICTIVEIIGSTVERQADFLNINPLVLEQLVHCVDYIGENNVNCGKIKDILTAKDVSWDKANNVVVLVYETDNRSIEYRIPLANLQKVIREEILPVYERFHWKDIDMFVTTKYSDEYVEDPCTFVMLYTLFRKISDPTHGLIKPRRFKGLGEMSKEAIKYTCIDPQTRCYTVVRGIGDVNRIFKMLGVDTDERKKLINSGLVEEV